MIAADLKPSFNLKGMDAIQNQPERQAYQLEMQWSLDENSKLICQWVKVQK